MYKRRYGGRKRSKIPSVRRAGAQAARAAASNQTSVRMCKDIGALWPGCSIVKLKLHFVSFVGGVTAGVGVINNAVQGSIVAHPYRPLAALSVNTGWAPTCNDSGNPSGGTNTLITRSAVGFTKLVGTADPSIYLRVATLRMQYRLKLRFFNNNSAVGAPCHMVNALRGYTRPFDNTEALLGNPTSENQMDLNLSQPHVRQRYARKLGASVNMNAFTAGPSYQPMPEMVMTGSVWPHRTMEIPWATYLGNDTSFGTSSANPTDLASLEWCVRAHQPSTTVASDATPRYPQYFVYMEGSLVFTCLFKDPIGGLT